MNDCDWLIVGGGVHGTHISHALVTAAGLRPSRVRVLDPHEQPLECLWRVTAATGMTYLRSPAVHNIDLHAFSMRRFAKRGAGKRHAKFVFPCDRPGLAFFRQHTESVIRAHGLESLRVQGQATEIARIADGYRVTTDRGSLTAGRVVLALGLGEQLCVPDWASALSRERRIEHIFAPAFERGGLRGATTVAIVGGGISAAQLACALAHDGSMVTVIARHAPRVHRFDSDPKWLGPLGMNGFAATSDFAKRRAVIANARNRGSMPPEIAANLKRELRAGRVRWIEAGVTRAERADVGPGARLTLDGSDELVAADRVVLATGFETHRPGGRLLDDDAVDRLGLPCAACGYPIVSPRLEWADGLFVTGPLAELELGPTARNIAGARTAAMRLVSAA